MITIKQYTELTLISNAGICNNRLVRAQLAAGNSLIHSEMGQDKRILASESITNDYNITEDSTNQAITDILLLDKHKKINKEIENYINNL